jgi:hypothetical protein
VVVINHGDSWHRLHHFCHPHLGNWYSDKVHGANATSRK